jgi:hypothetical protein
MLANTALLLSITPSAEFSSVAANGVVTACVRTSRTISVVVIAAVVCSHRVRLFFFFADVNEFDSTAMCENVSTMRGPVVTVSGGLALSLFPMRRCNPILQTLFYESNGCSVQTAAVEPFLHVRGKGENDDDFVPGDCAGVVEQ